MDRALGRGTWQGGTNAFDLFQDSLQNDRPNRPTQIPVIAIGTNGLHVDPVSTSAEDVGLRASHGRFCLWTNVTTVQLPVQAELIDLYRCDR